VSSTNTTASAPDDGATNEETAEGAIILLDPSTGLESPSAWRRAVDDEVVRLARYHRPATVMLLELGGFERLTERLGEPAGARLVLATARTIHSQARAADRCGRFGRGRFAILLPETDEIMAINFAERVRAECDRWLEAGEVTMRVAIGWATLDPSQGATAVILEAERRLDAERRQHAGSAA
jgi:diguanylate cyclase (GGDEF)-like protein